MAIKLFVYPKLAAQVSTSGLATEAKQDLIITEVQATNTALGDVNSELDLHTTELQSINTELDTQTTELQSVNTELDTQTTALNDINSELDTQTTALNDVNSELDTQTTALNDINTELNTQTTELQNLVQKLPASFVNIDYDEVILTYVGSSTRINTATFRKSAVTVRILTFSYDINDRLDGVVAT
jgi:chromosome segregation ATPase